MLHYICIYTRIFTAGVLSKDEIEKGWSDLDRDHDGQVSATLQNTMLHIILYLVQPSLLSLD